VGRFLYIARQEGYTRLSYIKETDKLYYRSINYNIKKI